MFGLFGPKCPVGSHEKAWIEWRLRWLAERFGLERMKRARVILPTPEFFPDELAHDESGAHECLARLCKYMEVDPKAVTLRFVPDDDIPGAAGLYEMRQQSVICVADSQLDDPARMLATMAHELAHELLLKGGHLTTDEPDHEQVTDLLPVFLGTGIFLANGTVQSSSESNGQWNWFQISRQGYLNSNALGYALAVFAHVRDEGRPAWAKHLRADASEPLWKGLNYLRRTGDSLLGPESTQTDCAPSSRINLLGQLGDESVSGRLAAQFDLVRFKFLDPEILERVEHALHDRDRDVRCQSVRTLGHFGSAAAGNLPRLIKALSDREAATRAAAATTIGQIATNPSESVAALIESLKDESPHVIACAAQALGTFGPDGRASEPYLLEAMAPAAVDGDARLTWLILALRAVSADPAARIREHFADDSELRRLALGVLKDWREPQAGTTFGDWRLKPTSQLQLYTAHLKKICKPSRWPC